MLQAVPTVGRGRVLSGRVMFAVKRAFARVKPGAGGTVSGPTLGDGVVTAPAKSSDPAVKGRIAARPLAKRGKAGAVDTGCDANPRTLTVHAHVPEQTMARPAPSKNSTRLQRVRSAVSCFGGGGDAVVIGSHETRSSVDADVSEAKTSPRMLEVVMNTLRAVFAAKSPSPAADTASDAPLPGTLASVALQDPTPTASIA